MQKIEEHEDQQHSSMRNFMGQFLDKVGHPMPDQRLAKGEVLAEVNYGRWIAECPVNCGGAVVASQKEPYFLCPYCFNAENDGQWYNVVFPAQKEAIEQVLLRRPTNRAGLPLHRNWKPGERVADLVRQNQEHGIS